MAHALIGYDGPCKNVHGHSYRLEVTIAGEPNTQQGDPKLGMVMDFGDLKAIVAKHVLNHFDHSTFLNKETIPGSVIGLENIFGKLNLVEYQPTCENLLLDIRKRISDNLPTGVSLALIRLHETATSYAEILESENLNGY